MYADIVDFGVAIKVYFFVNLKGDGNFLSFFQKQAVPPQLAANCD